MVGAVPEVAEAVLLLSRDRPRRGPGAGAAPRALELVGGAHPSPAGRPFLSLVVRSELGFKSQTPEV